LLGVEIRTELAGHDAKRPSADLGRTVEERRGLSHVPKNGTLIMTDQDDDMLDPMTTGTTGTDIRARQGDTPPAMRPARRKATHGAREPAATGQKDE
jgi:hypothetical protein